MTKRVKIVLATYIIIGIALIVTGLTIQADYYTPLIFAMGVGLMAGSIVQFLRYHHNTKPENIASYNEKKRQQSIDLKDERKVQIRNRAGYITWAITMIICFMAAFVAALLHVDALVIGILFGIGILEVVVANIIYKYLCGKM